MSSKPSTSGFSLVELLVVIAVIAIIAAIAIPNISNITQSADQATKIRNAQQLVATVESALAFSLGNPDAPSTVAATNLAVLIPLMAEGITIPNTRLGVTNTFRVPGITTNNVAMEKITIANGQIAFNPDGGEQ